MKPGIVAAPDSREGGSVRKVIVARRSDCAHGVAAVAAVRRLAEALGVSVSVEEIIVETDEEARASLCLGSPTLLIHGRDIEPAARGLVSFGTT